MEAIADAIMCAAALTGMVGCLIAAGVKGQSISGDDLKGENLWMTAVWCWMTSKWTMMMAIYGRRYGRQYMTPLSKSNPMYMNA